MNKLQPVDPAYVALQALEPESCVNAFIQHEIDWVPGNRESVTDMHVAYSRFCMAEDFEPLGWVAFGLEMYRRGWRTNMCDDDEIRPKHLALIGDRFWLDCDLWRTPKEEPEATG